MHMGDRGLEMFEERFGRWPTTLLLLLIGLGVGAFAIYTFVFYFVIPVWGFVSAHLPHPSLPEITSVTAIYVSAAIAAGALVVPALVTFWRQRRVHQRVIDQLAELRTRGIAEILNGVVTSLYDYEKWKENDDAWTYEVLAFLQSHFPRAESLLFQSIGAFEPVVVPHAYNADHQFRLQLHIRRLFRIEDIITRRTR
jgi:hypothetical protein